MKTGHVGAAPWLRVLQVLLAVLALAAGVARAELFDLVTFDAPAGMRNSTAEAVGFSEATSTTFVTYAVYKSAASSGDTARDYQDEWKLLLGAVPTDQRAEVRNGGLAGRMEAAEQEPPKSGATSSATLSRC